ncbi:MAG: patatin-like phospholipase family protein [Pyrinomonadaceae bacterium]
MFRSRKNLKLANLFTLAILLAGTCSILKAQDVEKNRENKIRPKVGLVLSGGGARGLAHIGVLKVLEENHVPVDYISGASMGALVGAMYAMGKSPEELEKIVMGLNWGELLRGRTAYNELSFRRKQDRRDIPGAIVVSGKEPKDLKLPNSLNPGHEIGLLIDNLTFDYGTISNFNDFPIPFRCVATDMVNAETIVLKSGSIQRSLRATMAIPAVFAPVEIDGRILADGGILNNIPAEVVKEMGADIVLVVDIETQMGDRRSLESLIGVLGQTIMVATIENSRRSLKLADILLAPDLEDHTTADFGASREIIDLGYKGAKAKEQILKSLSLSDEEWNKHLAARRARILPDTPRRADFIAVKGTDSHREKDSLEADITEKFAGKDIVKSDVENELTKITGTGRFDRLGYSIEVKDGETGLVVRDYDPLERAKRKQSLALGVEVNNSRADDVNFNLRGRYTIFDPSGFGSELRTDFSLGSRTFIGTEFYKPLGTSRFFLAPAASYENRAVGIYDGDERIAEYRSKTAQVGIDLGFGISRKAESRVGFRLGSMNLTRKIGSPELDEGSGFFSAADLQFQYDNTNDEQIPMRGIRFQGKFSYFFDSPELDYGLPTADFHTFGSSSLNAQTSLVSFANFGTTFGKTPGSMQQFTLGGLFRLSGYRSDEFRGRNYLHGGIGFLRETPYAPSYLLGKIYLGGWYEVGSAFDRFSDSRFRQSVSGGVIFRTPIGPVFFGGSLAEGGRGKLHFSLGRIF